eukprot:gnl/TRDRNA2_/TRDRNA2_146746_c1_seq1.p1 gnl/TRDRNA2_/TRDRNA2_146746_c1~~gnl/TRDRNA2_/TRDRNA2_146746_c1_seq1.p1  ORF type:complete len:102 (+),score=12.87 gnl/TRDRNA2_/TRDRNA2_146746_c1_seq1:572-877(+)
MTCLRLWIKEQLSNSGGMLSRRDTRFPKRAHRAEVNLPASLSSSTAATVLTGSHEVSVKYIPPSPHGASAVTAFMPAPDLRLSGTLTFLQGAQALQMQLSF